MIYSISDLHLDYTGEKSMELFGKSWDDYENRIFKNWKNLIKEDDLVLIAGDISWQMNLEDAYYDLKRISDLPGLKMMIRGNHDYWWGSISKNRKLDLPGMIFIQNDSFDYKDYSICGSRGWNSKDHPDYDEHDEKVFRRELIRLEMSLKDAKKNKIICMIHYPPFDKNGKPNEFGRLMEKYDVEICIYGHLHGDGLHQIVEGEFEGTKYFCTSSDYIRFKPRYITGD